MNQTIRGELSLLGRVDGFNQDQSTCEGDERSVILFSFLTAHGDAFKTFQLADRLFDAGAGFVESFGEEFRPCLGIRTVWDDRADIPFARRLTVSCRVISFVSDHHARRYIGANIKQDLKMTAVAGLTARKTERDWISTMVSLQMNFCRETAPRTAESLGVLPPFAPAADTCARTIVESNICTRWALWLKLARASKKASKVPDRLSRQNRFQTLFQWPNSAGSARQVML